MKKILQIMSVVSLLAMIFPIIMPAQELPSLPQDSNIKTGSLPCGVNYYIATNSTYKGMADIALVQKFGSSYESEAQKGETIVHSRASLTDLPHFSMVSPFAFLRGMSIWPSSQGYVQVSDDATIYRFDNLDISARKEIVDSTLLMIFDVIDKQPKSMKNYYSPDSQAIIVSGDVDITTLLAKMENLSLLVTPQKSNSTRKAYTWKETTTPKIIVRQPANGTSITISYNCPRTPQKDMGSVLPLVTSRYSGEMRILIERRLQSALASEKVPYSDMRVSYFGSSATAGDERFDIFISSKEGHDKDIIRIASSVLASLDTFGAGKEEYAAVSSEFLTGMEAKYGASLATNANYVDRCIGAFLYGSSLASFDSESKFFASRKMDNNTAAGLFNNYMSAILDSSRNLTLVSESNLSSDEVLNAFRDGWKAKKQADAAYEVPKISQSKSKVKSTEDETLFGGNILTFDNGVKVVCDKTGDSGYFHYAWVVEGGSPDSKGRYEEVFSTFKVANLSGTQFRDMLSANGITMATEISLSDCSLIGIAANTSVPVLVKSLVAVANDLSFDKAAYEYYCACKGVEDTNLPSKAKSYFDGVFGRMNKGCLIFSGDFDEDVLKKELTRYMGNFKIDNSVSYRTRRKVGEIARHETTYAVAADPSISMSMEAPIIYSAENYIAANIAAYSLSEGVFSSVASSGWMVSPSWSVDIFPHERLDLGLHLSTVRQSGLPASLMRDDSADNVLSKAMDAISAYGKIGISDEAFAAGKQVISNYCTSLMKDPDMRLKLLALRYVYSKDLVTDMENKCSSVKKTQVDEIVKSLASGVKDVKVVRKADTKDFVEAEPSVLNYPEIPAMPSYNWDSKLLEENVEE